MNSLVKSIVAVFALVLASSLSAQPVYKLNEHSPMIIVELPIWHLRQVEDSRRSENENLTATFYLDHTAKLNETEIYALRQNFEPTSKIPTTIPRSTNYWLYLAVENVTSHGMKLLDDFRPPSKECTVFEWKNGSPQGSISYDDRSYFNPFKGINPFKFDSANKEIRDKTITLESGEKLEFLVRCTVPQKRSFYDEEASSFNSDQIFSGIWLVQSEPYQLWSRWQLYTRALTLGILVALFLSSMLAAIVDNTPKSWLLSAWILMIASGSALNKDFFEFLYDGENNNNLASMTEWFNTWILINARLLFLFFSYHSLGGNKEFFNSPLSRRLKKPIIFAMIFCAIVEAIFIAPGMVLRVKFDYDWGAYEFYQLLLAPAFGSQGEKYFTNALAICSMACLCLVGLSVLYVATYQFRRGSRSALFILLALVFTTFANSVSFELLADIFMGDMEYIHYRIIKDRYPVAYLPLIVQALIMFYAVFRRNKEIQISLAEMTLNRQRFIEEQNALLENRVIERTQELQLQTEKTEKLMLNILPQSIAERLKDGDKEVSDKYQNTTILFSDLVGFTKMSSEKTPEELVFLLNDLFKRFDIRALSLGLEKIKTIGDAYMVVGGLPTVDDTHAIRVTKMALGMYEDLAEFNAQHGVRFDMRIGINSGPVVAGVIGHSKFSYDLWGNAVNTASRMESTSVPGKIQVSPSTFEQIKDHFDVQEHQLVECKGLGQIMTYFVNGQLPGGGPAFA
jgi:class 3 adenylate cyclase